jgi:GTP cyclohydrolase I
MTKNRKYKKDVENILLTLGMDLTDDSIKAHLTVLLRCLLKKFWGLNPERKPKASTFDNNYKYGVLVEKHYRPT